MKFSLKHLLRLLAQNRFVTLFYNEGHWICYSQPHPCVLALTHAD
jgi:hypothetical protein